MKQKLNTLSKILLSVLLALLVFLIGLSVYHHIALRAEEEKIVPPGKMVTVNGHNMHTASFGDQKGKPTIVLLSGSGTAAPIYDFKVLYDKLSEYYTVVVVERAGYGYSETSDAPRDVHTVMEETRSALAMSGAQPPYLLMPHSIAGVESLYYAQMYPEEILGIVGLDMTIPQSAENIPVVPFANPIMQVAGFVGLQRIPVLYPIEYLELSDSEMAQAKLLTYRNAFNIDVRNEIALTHENISQIDLQKILDLPILAFVSDDEDNRSDYQEFAERMRCQVVEFDAGHYIHQFKSEEITKQTRDFIEDLC